MAKHVEFGMYWGKYGRQRVQLPDNIDPKDKDAVISYLKSIWDDIPIPGGTYVPGSDELDEESIFEVYETRE